MNKIVVISRYITRKTQRKKNSYLNIVYFHFYGVYMGRYVKKLSVITKPDVTFKKKYDYLLYLKYIRIIDDILICKLLKYKKVE